jgi:hypothetical protein
MQVVRIMVTLYASTPEDLVNALEELGYQTGEVEVIEEDDQ